MKDASVLLNNGKMLVSTLTISSEPDDLELIQLTMLPAIVDGQVVCRREFAMLTRDEVRRLLPVLDRWLQAADLKRADIIASLPDR